MNSMETLVDGVIIICWALVFLKFGLPAKQKLFFLVSGCSMSVGIFIKYLTSFEMIGVSITAVGTFVAMIQWLVYAAFKLKKTK